MAIPSNAGPAQGIADMRARIALLKENKKNILDQIEANPVKYRNDAKYQAGMDRALAEIEPELREAQERLREYQAQQKGLN